jgi:hypothetical protein
MKAAVYTRYGPPDIVQIKDVEKPVPKDNEVLIQVRAAKAPIKVNLEETHESNCMYKIRTAGSSSA